MAHARARWGLKGKLTLSILVVGTLPLVVGMVLAFVQGTRELRELSGSSFTGIASETARKLDLIFSEEITRTIQIASDPLIIEALKKQQNLIREQNNRQVRAFLRETAQRWEARDPEIVQLITEGKLAKLLKQYYSKQHEDPAQSSLDPIRVSTRALFLTDSNGQVVASISPNVPYSNAGQAWWEGSYYKGKGRIYFENVYFDANLKTYAFSLSVPVIDKTRLQTIGVLHRVYDAKQYLDSSLSPVRFGKTGHVMLIDSEGTVMSCPILPTGVRLTDKELITLVTQPQGGWVKAPNDGHGGHTMSIIGFSPLSVTSSITKTSTGKAWHTFDWQSSDELFAPMRNLFKWITFFGLLGIGLLGTLGYVAAAKIVKPIRRLQEGAMLMGQGALSEPIRVETGDEIQQLADEFNRMSSQLQQTFSGLKHKVQERTQEVQFLQEYNEKILESVPNPIILFDMDERIDYVNRAAREALNLPNGDMRKCYLFDLIETDEMSQSRLREEIRSQVKLWENKYESPASSDQMTDQLRDPLTHKSDMQKDQANLRKELRIGPATYRYDLFHISEQFAKREQIGLVLRDTTEESRLQDQIIQTERLASLEVLTAGIGHELNNPLFGIMSLGESILDEQDIPHIKEHTKRILDDAKRMAGIIQDFSGQAHLERTSLYNEVDIHQQLDHALKMLGLTGPTENLKIQKNYQPLPRIQARPEEIVQVFINIIKNAIQAMKGKGTVQLTTSKLEGMVVIRISDSGPGIPHEFVPRIFDPFFTTKGPGQGIGLGLTIARRIVLNYGGLIDVETNEEKGTSFILTFPALESDSPDQQE